MPKAEFSADCLRITWLVFAVLALASLVAAALSGHSMFDADAHMRLQEVRDLLNGQSWFDVTQYRMNAPVGTAMHWSRLVDLPLAAIALMLGLFLTPELADFWAAALVQLFYLGAGLFTLRAIMLRLGITGIWVLAGLAVAVAAPLLPNVFGPMKIDHHAPQAVAGLLCVLMFLKAPCKRAAMMGGLVGAYWLNISLEGLPVIALLAGFYGVRYALAQDRALGWFLGSLAIATPILSLATRSMSEFALWCDIVGPAHFAGFGAGAVIAFAIPYLPRQNLLAARFAALGLLPLVCGPIAISMLGSCPVDPFGDMDPLLKTFFHENVLEGLPFWHQPLDVMAMMLVVPILLGLGLHAASKTDLFAGKRREDWLYFAGLTAGVTIYGLWLLREMVLAQVMLVPFSVALFQRYMPMARNIKLMPLRVLASVACIMLATPIGATLIGKYAKSALPAQKEGQIYASGEVYSLPDCDYRDLRALPAGSGLFTTINSAPGILALTNHSVEVGGYHRNEEALRRVILAFRGNAEEAHRIMQERASDYLVICFEEGDLPVFGRDKPQSLAQRIMRDDLPEWLELDERFTATQLRVWRVR